MLRKTLLAGGILSSVLYATMLVVVARAWPGYSSASQTVSELSAIGAPTRAFWATLGAFYTALVIAFGWGVWISGEFRGRLRTSGALILVYGLLGLLWPFASMHQREVIAAGGSTWTDTAHIALATTTVLLMFAAMGFGAVAFGPRFRRYSIASLIVLVTFGALTFMDAPRISANLPTPWIGVWERLNIGVFLLWIAVLGVAAWRMPAQHRTHTATGS